MIDAVTTKHRPLWTEMEDKILTVFNQAKDAAEMVTAAGLIQISIPFFPFII